MSDEWIKLMTKAVELGGKLVVKSALNPILWLCGVVDIPILAAIVILSLNKSSIILIIFLSFVFLLPIGCAIFSAFYFVKNNPDKLQSEEYQLRNRTLDIIEQKGDKFPVLAETVELITNPKIKMVKSGGKK